MRAALHESFEGFVEFVAATVEEGKTRGIVRPDVDARMVAWQFLGIGMTLDIMHIVGFSGEMDRARAAMWGRVYLDAVKRTPVGAPSYASESGPLRAPAAAVPMSRRGTESRLLMDFHDAPEEAAFRTEVRAFIRDECPAGISRRGFGATFGGGGWDDLAHGDGRVLRRSNAEWVKKLADRGWIAPAWPKEYGGAGMTRDGAVHLQRGDGRGARAAARRHRHRLGRPDADPLRHRGAEAGAPARHPQRRRSVWCQGYQRARRRLRPRLRCRRAPSATATTTCVNGQKIWTSGAHVRGLDDPARPHRPGRAQAPRHHATSCSI